MTTTTGAANAKPPLTLLLGAGFSQALRIPGTAAIGAAVDAALQARFGNLYVDLRERLRARFGDRYNFEVLAAALEACETFGQPGYVPGARYLAVEPEVAELRGGLTPEHGRDMYELLISVVVQHVSTDWESVVSPATRDKVQDFFGVLRAEHRLDIATLNYDGAVETFVTDAVDGFVGQDKYQRFKSEVFLAADDAPRIAHLHGSLRYGITEAGGNFVKNTGALEPRRVPLWSPRLDGSYYTGMITGADKPNKLVLPPYSVYFAWLANRLLNSPRMVVVGYGIGDVHVNVWLANAARHHTGSDYRVVIVDFFNAATPPRTLIEFFAYAAGLENGVDAEPVIQGLTYEDGIASLNGAMIVRTGMDLTAARLERIKAFLQPPR